MEQRKFEEHSFSSSQSVIEKLNAAVLASEKSRKEVIDATRINEAAYE